MLARAAAGRADRGHQELFAVRRPSGLESRAFMQRRPGCLGPQACWPVPQREGPTGAAGLHVARRLGGLGFKSIQAEAPGSPGAAGMLMPPDGPGPHECQHVPQRAGEVLTPCWGHRRPSARGLGGPTAGPAAHRRPLPAAMAENEAGAPLRGSIEGLASSRASVHDYACASASVSICKHL